MLNPKDEFEYIYRLSKCISKGIYKSIIFL